MVFMKNKFIMKFIIYLILFYRFKTMKIRGLKGLRLTTWALKRFTLHFRL